jgi:hypothetical protein
VAAVGAGRNHCVPLALTFSLNSPPVQEQVLAKVLRGGAEFAEELADDGADNGLRFLRKQGPTLAGLVSHLIASQLPLITFDGLLFLHPDGTAPGADRPAGQLVLTAQAGEPDHWSTEVVCPVQRWGDTPLGQFTFGLEVRAVG